MKDSLYEALRSGIKVGLGFERSPCLAGTREGRMESKFRILGHGAHPILIVFPLGLLSTAVIFDLIYLIAGNPQWTVVSYWLIAAGAIGGLVAAVPGLIDWVAIPSETRAKSVGLIHGVGNVVVVGLFGASWFLRRGSVGGAFDLITSPPTIALVL